MNTLSTHDHGNCELCDQLERERAQLRDAIERYQAIFFGRLGNMKHMSTEEFRKVHAATFMHASDVLRQIDKQRKEL